MTMTKDGIKDVTTQEEKAQRAGFNQPTGTGPKPVPAPMAAPAPVKEEALKVVEGQITAIDYGTHEITVKDRAGESHKMVWTKAIDERMAKLKQWWFCKIMAEKDGDFWKVMDQTFFKRPDDWPVSAKGGYGGKPFTPRNEKIIVLQSNFRTITDLFNQCTCPDTQSFDEACEVIYEKALAITARMMLDGAVK